jgi:hypothetical protein
MKPESTAEESLLVTVVAMAWLLLRYLLAVQHTAAPPTVQAARMLQYWATLLLVHASAFAWFRRAASPKSALLGFAGILYLGCGYVFSLALAAIFELAPWPEEWKMVLWSAILPLVAWSSSLLGCFLLLRALTRSDDESRTPAGEGAKVSPQSLECPAFVPLVSVSLFLATLLAGVVFWRAAGLMHAWYHRQTAERSADYLGVILYTVVYLLVSLGTLAAAWVSGRRALKKHGPELLWRAGVLAVVGGLLHVLLLGLPALCGGLLALRAANRSSPRPPHRLWNVICQSCGCRPRSYTQAMTDDCDFAP